MDTNTPALDINKKYLYPRDYWALSLANFGVSSLLGFIIAYLLIFYTSVLGIPPATAALMFLIAKFFDAFNDPFMGVIVDKTQTKIGKMRPYLLFGSIPFVAVVMIMFLPIASFSSAFKIIFMYVTFLFYSLTSTVVGVPVEGLATVISPNPKERTKAIEIGRTIYTIGEQSSIVIVFIGFTIFNNDMALTYMFSAILLSVIAGASLIFAGIRLKERVPQPIQSPRLRDGFKYTFKNKPFLMLFLASLINCFKWVFTGMIIYVVTYIYGDSSLQIWFAAPSGLAAVLVMIFVPRLNRKFEAKTLFKIGVWWYSIGLLIVYLVGVQSWIVTALLLFFVAAATGIFNIVPTIMAADTIDYWEHKTGFRQEGITFSIMSLKNKVGLGLKDFIIGYFLAYFMFNPSDSSILGHQPRQFIYTQEGMFFMFLVIPAVLNLLTLIPLKFYDLDKKKLAQMSIELKDRRAEEQKEKDRLEQIRLDKIACDREQKEYEEEQRKLAIETLEKDKMKTEEEKVAFEEKQRKEAIDELKKER